MDEYISQLSWGGWLSFQLFLGDGDGLEAVQLLEQAAALGGVQAVDEVARALRRVQRLHGLLLGVCAQPPGAAPGRRAGREGSGGWARSQAARGPAPQQRQQPGHGGRSVAPPSRGRGRGRGEALGSARPAPSSSGLAAAAPGTMHAAGPRSCPRGRGAPALRPDKLSGARARGAQGGRACGRAPPG